jgi:glycosyltransferase involved in cell wall biosynthesis
MPVYDGVPSAHFALALESVFAQTRAPDAVVVVSDGPLTPEQEQVLSAHPTVLRVDLPTRAGIGPALAAGLAVCEGEWVARADADDINEPHRLASQLSVLDASGGDVCSSAMAEFLGSPDRVVGVRPCPIAHRDIARRMRMANPVNHPTVVFRRELAVSAGGYQDLPYVEDYDLWARMLQRGAVFVGTQEPLVRFRADGLQDRRTAPGALKSERLLQCRLREYGLISVPRMCFNILVRAAYLRLPRPILRLAYRILLRGPASGR